jgi:TRAP-type C4-dicarboxylate transport system substrate-binding protein
MKQTRKIRWLIAHEPVELFLRTAEAFKQKIAELTDDAFEVEIFTPTQYAEKFGKIENHLFPHLEIDPMVHMDEGDIEMSQMHITELARWDSPDFYALELPFLFRDHDHAARVLEGPIGRGLLDTLADNSPAKGLAFTYSGGFRCVASDKDVTGIDDFKDIVYACGPNPITVDMVKAFGATPKTFTIRDFVKNAGRIEGYETNVLETTIPRYLALFKDSSDKRFLVNTKHSLFLTSIIVSTKFWESLGEELQAKFQEACTYASRLERKWSVEDAENFAAKQDHSDIGVTYREFTAEETEKLKELTSPVYEKYKDFFYPGLVDGIIKS